MDDTQILDWLQAHGEEIYTVYVTGTEYLVLAWNDADGETQRTYGSDLRDAVRGAIAGEGMPGKKLVMPNVKLTGPQGSGSAAG